MIVSRGTVAGKSSVIDFCEHFSVSQSSSLLPFLCHAEPVKASHARETEDIPLLVAPCNLLKSADHQIARCDPCARVRGASLCMDTEDLWLVSRNQLWLIYNATSSRMSESPTFITTDVGRESPQPKKETKTWPLCRSGSERPQRQLDCNIGPSTLYAS